MPPNAAAPANDGAVLSNTNTTNTTTSSNNKSKPRTTNTNNKTWSTGDGGLLPARESLGPLILMLITPPFSIIYFHVVSNMQGDFLAFAKLCWQGGLFKTIYGVWPTPWDGAAWMMILGFMGFELMLMKYMPGKEFKATVTPNGNQPVYTANGFQCYTFTLLTFLLLTTTNLIQPAIVYDKFGQLLSSMNLFALLFCLLLLIKGHIAPSTTDSGSRGNVIMDYYWGMELYPNILGFDVKMFTNCRFGMMFWAVGILCFAAKNMQVNHGHLSLGMFVNVTLQLIYISKFFYWEMGYMCSMDIQHDRAGFYICWGCLVWVPSVYTSHAFYLAEHAPPISLGLACMMMVLGTVCIWINFDSDNQRYIFRQTKGECLIWGTKPNKIVAEYTTENGTVRKSLLLVGGWWSVSRHFHYLPEIGAAFVWSSPALNTALVGPYFYVMFLTILLTDRAFRDDQRCRKKYGRYWDLYCKEVPYKMIPGVV